MLVRVSITTGHQKGKQSAAFQSGDKKFSDSEDLSFLQNRCNPHASTHEHDKYMTAGYINGVAKGNVWSTEPIKSNYLTRILYARAHKLLMLGPVGDIQTVSK